MKTKINPEDGFPHVEVFLDASFGLLWSLFKSIFSKKQVSVYVRVNGGTTDTKNQDNSTIFGGDVSMTKEAL